jgi:hypothetical protein
VPPVTDDEWWRMVANVTDLEKQAALDSYLWQWRHDASHV